MDEGEGGMTMRVFLRKDFYFYLCVCFVCIQDYPHHLGLYLFIVVSVRLAEKEVHVGENTVHPFHLCLLHSSGLDNR